MKKILIFLILSFFSLNSLAYEYSSQGILKDLVQNNADSFIEKKIDMDSLAVAEIGLDDAYRTTNRNDEKNDSFAGLRIYNNLNFNKNLSLNSYLNFHQIDNSSTLARGESAVNNSSDKAFKNIGMIVQEVTLDFKKDQYVLVAGKFKLDFGNAWRWDRGLWIHDLANNYIQTEKLGFSGFYRIGDAKKTGKYIFGFSTFTNDRKNLDNSLMVQRDSAHKNDALPGDTRSLESYNASLNVSFDFAQKEKLTYHFSYLNLAVNGKANSTIPADKFSDQKGFAAGMNYQYPLVENIDLDGLLEYVEMKNVGGNSDVGEKYLTANLITKFYRNYSILLGNSNRQNFQIGKNGFDQNLSEISLGYQFDKNKFFDRLTLQTGYKNQRANYKTSINTQNVFGILLRYYKSF
jgi:hypothetical protein